MYKNFVLDCSVTMAWCFADEASQRTDALQESLSKAYAVVPAIWLYEVANVLWNTEKTGRITMADSIQFKSLLQKLPITVDEITTSQIFEGVSTIAREQVITVYDAAYLELSLRKGLPLATLDKQLLKAAKNVGIEVL